MSTPILSKKFFDQHQPDSGFFSKWRALGPWSEKCLPIYEWDGVLFIACLYPPADFPKLNLKSVFVLCDPESLKNVWYEYQGTVVGVSAPLKPAALKMDEMPEGLSATLSTPSAPEALSMDSFSEHLGTPSLVPDDNILEDVESAVPSAIEEDDNDFLSIADNPLNNKIAPTTLTAVEAPVNSAPQVEAEAVTDFSIAVASTKTENPYTKPGALSSNKGLIDQDVTKISVNALVKAPKLSLDSFMQSIFTEMDYHFQKTMVLLKDGEEMKPWRWDGKFQMVTDEDNLPEGIQLETPSPWRIVMRTQKPYHGHVVANEVNDKFFDAWNNAQAPAHLTLVPVMIEDHVIGMLMGFGEKSADNKNSLHLAEKLAEDISTQIRSQPEFLKSVS